MEETLGKPVCGEHEHTEEKHGPTTAQSTFRVIGLSQRADRRFRMGLRISGCVCDIGDVTGRFVGVPVHLPDCLPIRTSDFHGSGRGNAARRCHVSPDSVCTLTLLSK